MRKQHCKPYSKLKKAGLIKLRDEMKQHGKASQHTAAPKRITPQRIKPKRVALTTVSRPKKKGGIKGMTKGQRNHQSRLDRLAAKYGNLTHDANKALAF